MNKMKNEVWVASGLRTPFAKEHSKLKAVSATALSVAVLNQMKDSQDANPDYVAWGTVMPNLEYSNIARDIVLESTLKDETIAFTSTMACSTSLLSAIQMAAMVTDDELAIAGGVESMSNVQLGLTRNTSNWLKQLSRAKGLLAKLKLMTKVFSFRIYIPPGVNRVTGKSMGQHAEITAQRLGIDRTQQDELALRSHQNYFKAKAQGFFDDLLFPAFNVEEDSIPRAATSLDKLATLNPVFDRKSGKGSLTAGNSTLFTDGAASVWVAGKNRIKDLNTPYKARIVDWEMAGVTIEKEGILMSPSFAIPKVLERNNLTYDAIDVWEIHEAFASQVLSTIKNLEDKTHLKKVGVSKGLGAFPIEKLNPNGSSIAIGHPFGATGARILSQAVKELSLLGSGKKALISVCADGGLGAVMLIEN